MKSVINFIKGMMNKDLDERLVPSGVYVNGLNIRTGSSESTEIGSIEKAGGNSPVATVYYDPLGQIPLEKPICIGAFKDDVNEVIYWFINDVSPAYPGSGQCDLVVSFNTKNQTLKYHVIDDQGILNFSKDYPITGVSLIEDLLFWTDGLNSPKRINVNSVYTGFASEEPFNVIVTPPSSAPSINLAYLSNQGNFLEENFISFAYRYKYANGEYSALSQFSDIAFLPRDFIIDSTSYLNEGMLNQYNAVNIGYFSGGSLVKEIELCYKKADSNEIYLIQKLNKQKENILDNVNLTFLFSNNKIYSALPSTEWFRLYDNVPHKAKALSIMGNRLMLANYTEGYDMISSDDQPVNINFGCEPLSEEITSEALTTTLSTHTYPAGWSSFGPAPVQSNAPNAKFRITIPTAYHTNIPAGLYIGFNLTLESSIISGGAITSYPQAPFTINFSFTTQRVYPTFTSLLLSVEFQQKLGTVSSYYQSADGLPCSGGYSLTDYFACSIQDKPTIPAYVTHAVGSTSTQKTGFTITTPIGQNYLEIAIPAMVYYNGVSYAYEYFKIRSISAEINKSGAPKSLHSNRDYQVGIVYMDDYNRSTPALTSNLNTVFFPSSKSIDRNRIKVTIPISQKPPKWATRYKFVAKSTKERYETIYTNIFFNDPSDQGLWIKLDGESQNKINVGDKLIVKSDSNGAVLDLVTTVVLEKEVKPEDFIRANTTTPNAATQISEPSGAYMRVKLDGWSANYNPRNYIDTGFLTAVSTDTNSSNPGSYASMSIPCFYSGTPVQRWDIPAGTTVLLSFRFVRNGKHCGGATNRCGETTSVFNAKFVASRNYNDFYEFWLGEGVNVVATVYPISLTCPDDAPVRQTSFNATIGSGSFPSYSQGTNKFQFFGNGTGPNAPLYLGIRQGAPACGGVVGIGIRKSIIEARIIIQKTGDNLIFETEPTNAIPNIYYENHETFGITSGNHLCNFQNQDFATSKPGISILDFYNCYSFGNGVESFKIKDSITGSYFLLGQRVTAAIESQFKQTHRFSDITYSGVYNRETNVNKLNEFNLGLSNYKLLEAMYGSIQKMHPRQTDLLVFQEDRVSRVLVGKNIISDLSGGNALVSVPEVLGNQIARIEEYGISENPESFASFGGDVYFTDAKRGAVLKLSGEQLTVISSVGMQDYFRANLASVKRAPIRGGYDPYNKDYILSVGDEPPLPIVYLDCGSETWIQGASIATIYRINLGNSIGTAQLIVSQCSTSANYDCLYNGTSIDTGDIGTNPTININKNLETVTYADFIVDPFEGGFLLTAICPVGTPVTVIVAVLTSNDDAGKIIDGIHWGVYPNHIMSDTVTVSSGAYPVLGKYQTISAQIGNGIVPPNSGNITMYTSMSQFNTISRFPTSYRFLRANTLFNLNVLTGATGLVSFLGAASSDAGTTTFDFAPYSAQQVTKNIGSTGDYIYMVWDYRTIGNANICNTGGTLAAACCDCNVACANSVELQTSGVFASQAQACSIGVENLIVSLYYGGGVVDTTKTFYFDIQQTTPAYPGVYKYNDTGVLKWFELNSIGKVLNTGSC